MDRTIFINFCDGKLDCFSKSKILIVNQNRLILNIFMTIYQLYNDCLMGFLTKGRLQKRSTFDDRLLKLPIILRYEKMVNILCLLHLLSLKIRSEVLLFLHSLGVKMLLSRVGYGISNKIVVYIAKKKRKNSCFLAA